MTTQHTQGRLYADRDIINQGRYYLVHVSAMAKEGLQSKSDIAAELAHRDIVIAELLGALKAASNYINVLGGDSKGYRQTIAKVERPSDAPT